MAKHPRKKHRGGDSTAPALDQIGKGVEKTKPSESAAQILNRFVAPDREGGIVAGSARFRPLELEKDDDLMMEFVFAAANLRAENYRIATADRLKVKQVAGRIAPAIATTTCLVSGLACLELYKLASERKTAIASANPKGHGEAACSEKEDPGRISRYRNNFVNLALPLLAASEPAKATIVGGEEGEARSGFTVWDCVEMQGGSTTIRDVQTLLHVRFGAALEMLSHGARLIFSKYSNLASQRSKIDVLDAPISALLGKDYEETMESSGFVDLVALASDERGQNVELPPIRLMM